MCYVNKKLREAGEYEIQRIWLDDRMYASQKLLRENILQLSEQEEHRIQIELA